MAKHRVTVGICEENFSLLEKFASFSSGQPGDVAKDILEEILDGLRVMFVSCEGDIPESARRKILRVGLNKMMDALDNDADKYNRGEKRLQGGAPA